MIHRKVVYVYYDRNRIEGGYIRYMSYKINGMFPITQKMKYNFYVLFCNFFLFLIINAVIIIIKIISVI